MFLKRRQRNTSVSASKPKLWTRNFIILSIGSFVSMIGDNAIDTIFGLMLLDLTSSGMVYSLLSVIENVLRIIIPVSVGPYVEKWKKEKVVYLMDFFAAGLFLLLAVISQLKLVSETVLLIAKAFFDVSCIVYLITYDSFFPMIVKKEVYPKAVSFSSIMGNCAEVASLIGLAGYEKLGVTPILYFSGICYFVAACLEMRIKPEVATAGTGKTDSLKDVFKGYKEAFEYVKKTEGYMSFLIYFFSDVFRTGAVGVLLLPYFEKYYTDNLLFGYSIGLEYLFVFIFTFMSIGEFWGGIVSYKMKLKPANRLKAQIIIGIIETGTVALSPFTPLPVTIVLMLISGLTSVITACIYDFVFFENVPPDMRGRFNGACDSIGMIIAILGNFAGGLVLDSVKNPGWGFLLTSIPQFTAMILLLCLRAKPLNAFFSGDKSDFSEQDGE